MQPILHLSIPVRDLAEARDFYVDVLGCEAARTRPDYQDVWFYGVQVTLHDRPDVVTARLAEAGVRWLSPVATDDRGLPTEQTTSKIAYPGGNVIELKSYADVTAALEISAHSYPEAIEHGN